jgi:hypothetical protein
VILGFHPTMQHFKSKSVRRSKQYYYLQNLGQRKGLKNFSKRNNVKLQYAKTSNENINDSEDINP